jgi:hypothetical protein
MPPAATERPPRTAQRADVIVLSEASNAVLQEYDGRCRTTAISAGRLYKGDNNCAKGVWTQRGGAIAYAAGHESDVE